MSTTTDTNTSVLRDAWSAIWCDPLKKDAFQVNLKNGTILTIKKGSWLKLPNRDDMVMVDSITTKMNWDVTYVGPVGITYLPWRYNVRRFASILWSMRGNHRFIICYPMGRDTYGQHIDWEQVEVGEEPDNIDPVEVERILLKSHRTEED